MADTSAVANRLLELAEKAGDSLTPMQVLKLVYLAHGWMLGLYGRPLINDEVQAWQYGPVIPRLYNQMRHFRSNPVTTKLQPSNDRPLDTQEASVVEQVYDIYGKMSGPALSRLTHEEGSPWAHTYVPGSFGKVIPVDIIEDYYATQAQRGSH